MPDIRKATLEDLELIVKFDMELADLHSRLDVLNKSGREAKSYFTKLYSQMLKGRNSLVLLAYDEKRICGFLSGAIVATGPFWKVKKIAEIEAAYVVPRYRGQGIGKSLLNRFISWAKGKKTFILKTSVHAKNLQALEFWNEHGFKSYGIDLRRKIRGELVGRKQR